MRVVLEPILGAILSRDGHEDGPREPEPHRRRGAADRYPDVDLLRLVVRQSWAEANHPRGVLPGGRHVLSPLLGPGRLRPARCGELPDGDSDRYRPGLVRGGSLWS